MLNNYYTLLHLVREFQKMLPGARILRASTRIKHTLDIVFKTESAAAAKIVVSCIPQNNFIYIDYSLGKKQNGANVLPEIVGKSIAAVGVVFNERQLYIEFSDRNFLRMNLFGSSGNVYYTSSDGVIVNSFLKPSASIGKRLDSTPNTIDFPVDGDDLRLRFSESTGDLVHQLCKSVPTVDSVVGREIVRRYLSLVEGRDAAGNSGIVFESLNEALGNVKKELLSPSPRIYLSDDDGKPIAFGLIELKHLQQKNIKKYDSLNDCVRDFALGFEIRKNNLLVNSDLIQKLKRRIDFLRRTLMKIDSDLKNDRSKRNQLFGEYLMSHLSDVRQGETSILIEESGVEIKLNPAFKAVQNAQAYFDKAKREKISIHESGRRRIELAKKLDEAEAQLKVVERQQNVGPHDRDKFSEVLKATKGTEENSRSPFREFECGGYKIYVGKDARNNDELTFGFAKPNDVFLHARGVSGSHVIIRNASREYPQKPVLQFAARIAAHYSKARSSGIAPVAYTMRKFIKKAKGKPGAVFLDREEVIFVKPGIPAE